MASISAVICTKDRPEALLATLYSLAAQTRQPDEIVIVDGGSSPPTADVERSLGLFGSHRYLATGPGLTRQRNIGIDESNGDLVFFFDDDVLPAADYVAKIAAVFEQDVQGRWGGGMGQILLPDRRGRWFHTLIARLFLLGEVGGRGCLKASGFPIFPHGAASFQKVDVLSGCCMAFRRAALLRHRCDERLTGYAYMEDIDLSYRISRQWPLFYEPSALLRHMTAPPPRHTRRPRAQMLVVNHHYLFEKNLPHSLRFRLAHGWSLLGLAVRAVADRSMDQLLGVFDGWRAIARQPKNV